jgi:hypothetical protein
MVTSANVPSMTEMLAMADRVAEQYKNIPDVWVLTAPQNHELRKCIEPARLSLFARYIPGGIDIWVAWTVDEYCTMVEDLAERGLHVAVMDPPDDPRIKAWKKSASRSTVVDTTKKGGPNA